MALKCIDTRFHSALHYGGRVWTTFLKTHDLTHLSDAFFKVDHDELNEIYILSGV